MFVKLRTINGKLILERSFKYFNHCPGGVVYLVVVSALGFDSRQGVR
jgi:hypothetical protein